MKKPKPFEIKLIASPKDFFPTRKDFKVICAFNPGVTTIKTPQGLETILFARVAEVPKKNISGKVLLPYYKIQDKEQSSSQLTYDIIDENQCIGIGEKEVTLKKGTSRLKHISLPRMIVLNSKLETLERQQEPAIYPSWEFDKYGIEDVRITHLEDGRYIITYATPHDKFGVGSSILTTNKIKESLKLERIISNNTPRPEIIGKDTAVFPAKVPSPTKTEMIDKGQAVYCSFIRPDAFPGLSTPGVWVSYSPDLVHWGQNHRLINSENGEVTGTGSPPVKRPYGWLEPYHETTRYKDKTKYVTKLMVLDLEEPWRVLRKSPVLLNREDFRDILPNDGYVPNTVFTTGIVINEGRTDIYSGIDDEWIGSASYYTEDIDKFAQGK